MRGTRRVAVALVLGIAAWFPASPNALAAPEGAGEGAALEAAVEHVSLEEGISHDLVFCILQDRKGFLWMGTMFGLVRYDGYEYRSYRHDPADPNTLSNDDVISLCEDRDGNLWVGTYGGGVNRFDRARGVVTRYLLSADGSGTTSGIVWAIAQDAAGRIWLGTEDGGACVLDPATGETSAYRHDPEDDRSLGADRVPAILSGGDGSMWLGTTGGGLCRFDAAAGGFTRLLGDARVRVLARDGKGGLWVGTAGEGLLHLDGRGGTIERFHHDADDPATLSANFVNAIAPGGEGVLWLGTPVGLERLDTRGGRFQHLGHDASDPGTLRGSHVAAVCQDRSGILWVGSYYGGLDRVRPGGLPFRRYAADPEGRQGPPDPMVNAFTADGSGALWIGTNGGLCRFDAAADSFSVPDLHGWPSGARVRSLVTDRAGAIWAGTNRGLHRVDAATGKVTSWRRATGDSAGIASDLVNAVACDSTGGIWLGTGAGLQRFDPSTGRFATWRHDPSDASSLASDFVLSLFVDEDGSLWAGSYGGTNRLPAGADRFTVYRMGPSDPTSISNNYAFSFHRDAKGRLWIGTGGGLDRFLPEDGTFRSVTEKDGLPNSVIWGMLEDGRGRLWLSTNRGLSCYDPESGGAENYDPSDGLQSNMFSAASAWRAGDGQLYFGGVNGFNRFDPMRIRRNEHVPDVAVTRLILPEEPDTPPVETAWRKAVVLSHRRSSFLLEFAALDFTHPARNRFRYRLRGVDREWIEAGARHRASYANVPPGRYRFEVQACNNDGVWNRAGAALQLTVTPPFWRTPWFYSLSALTLLLGTVFVHERRVRVRVRQVRAIEEARALAGERVRRRAAQDFHDELGHRLTKIGLFSEIAQRRLADTPNGVGEYLQRIAGEAHRLSHDTRDFIWSLDPQKDSLHDVLLHLEEFGRELFDRSDTAFSLRGLEEEQRARKLPVEVRRQLTLLLKEGLHNALKHSGASRVTLLARDLPEGGFELELADDGRGFDPARARAGNGLKGMRARAQKAGARFGLLSRPGEGTRIVLVLEADPQGNGAANGNGGRAHGAR